MKLISMVDFVLERKEAHRNKCLENYTDEAHCRADHSRECEDYANFLKRDLKLGMFVPCDLDGNVLEEKNARLIYTGNGKKKQIVKTDYQQAKERVLFETGSKLSSNGKIVSFILGDYTLGHYLVEEKTYYHFNHKTVEGLVKLDLTLTETAQKELEL